MAEDRKIRSDIFVVILLALIVFLIASLATYDIADPIQSGPEWLAKIYQPDQLVHPQNPEIQNACGFSGAWIADLLIHSLGVGAYFLIIGLVSLEFALVQKQSVESPWLKTAGWIVALLGLTTMGSLILPEWTVSPIIGAGGYLGALGSGLLGMQVGTAGTIIVASAISLVGMMMWTEYLIFRAGRLMIAPALVAASAALPFGILHRGFKWFNQRGEEDEHGLADTDVEEQIEIDGEEESDPVSIPFEQRSIKIKLGDQEEEFTQGEDGEYEEVDSDEEYEDEYDEEELEAEEAEYEEDDEPATIPLKVSSAEDDESEFEEEADEVEEPASSVHKPPHFKVPAQPKAKPPSEREVVMSQLEAADKIEADSDYEVSDHGHLASRRSGQF